MSIIENSEKAVYLRRYRDAAAEAERLEGELQRWRSLAERVTPGKGNGASQGGEDRLQLAVERIMELEGQLAEQLQEQVELRWKAQAVITLVPSSVHRQLLCLRYIDGLKWRQVAATMHYEESWVRRLHQNALEQLALENTPFNQL